LFQILALAEVGAVSALIIIIIIIIIIIEKVKKNGEANVPSGRPTQNYCATKQN